jgi:3'-phosphoadenosine 5'-phosphosulfate sulfotransferase (PAPS reductase)/FAD synthetase
MTARGTRLSLTPVTLRHANAFIAQHHRHHKQARGCISVVACAEGERLCGVAVIGRPLARLLQDGQTAEVTRCCTDGTANVCSKLYRAAWRSVKALGYRRLVTYTLPEEGGASLRAAGFTLAGEAGGGSWSRPASGRARKDEHPVDRKLRWEITTNAASTPTPSTPPHPSRHTSPDEVIVRARSEHQPVAVWCLFSGGNDSTVLAHRCREHYQGLAWIDTGTAVPGVAKFVHEYAEWVGKPLRVLEAGDAFRVMVLGDLVWWARFITAHAADPRLSIEAFIARDERLYGRASGGELGQVPHGFPGPGAHGRAYNRLKERRIMTLLRESKQGHPRSARVLFLSGIRRAESRRRAKREPINRLARTSAVFANPLIDWSGEEMRRYRAEHRVPESPAAALLHRSGECNCGAFAKAQEERAMLKALYPEFFAEIEALEAQAQAAGVRWCRWGGYDVHGNRAGETSRERPGLLCESCESRHHATIVDRPRTLRRQCVQRVGRRSS